MFPPKTVNQELIILKTKKITESYTLHDFRKYEEGKLDQINFSPYTRAQVLAQMREFSITNYPGFIKLKFPLL